jgi:hypothetical protein
MDRGVRAMSAVVRPRFFGIVAIAMSAFMALGFARTYYLRGAFDLPPLSALLHLHGVVFTAWLAVFILQTRLVAWQRIDLHRKLGMASVGLAVLVVVLGVATAVDAAARVPLRPSGRTGAQFVIIPLTTIALFAVFVALGVALRKKAAAHKRLMVLAMIAILGPATARLAGLLGLREYVTSLQLAVSMLFVAWCLIADWRAGRGVHPAFAIGGFVILASWPLRLWVSKTDTWQRVGEWIAS